MCATVQQEAPSQSNGQSLALQECSYGAWYPAYASLTPAASVVIDLDSQAEAFLHEDGLVLHDDSAALPQRSKPSDIVVEGVDYDPEDLYSGSSSSPDSDDDDARSSSSAGVSSQPWPQRFPGLHGALAAAITQLGGAVAPRLNWSSPTDVLWLTSSNSLKCTNPDEVLLLLKGSDRVAHDLEQLQQLRSTHPETPNQPQQQQQQDDSCQHERASSDLQADTTTATSSSSSSRQPLPAQLVLRSWCALDHEWQFRAFVSGHRVVAISQRDPSQHFPQLASAAAAEGGQHSLASIKRRLVAFHSAHIGSSFPLDSYAMDVYVPPRGRVQLLDFSPISSTTSPLCFDWEDLPYAHMEQQQQDQDQQQQAYDQQQQVELQEGGGGPGSPASGSSSSSAGSSSAGSSSSSSIEFRVVEHEGMIVPGTRVATGMPYDMLGLPDAVSAVMAAMQQQGLQ